MLLQITMGKSGEKKQKSRAVPRATNELPQLFWGGLVKSGGILAAAVIGAQQEFHGSFASGYSGMLPCFFGGFASRLFRSIANAVISFRRVNRGSMISST